MSNPQEQAEAGDCSLAVRKRPGPLDLQLRKLLAAGNCLNLPGSLSTAKPPFSVPSMLLLQDLDADAEEQEGGQLHQGARAAFAEEGDEPVHRAIEHSHRLVGPSPK
jgi:hypothetical protein